MFWAVVVAGGAAVDCVAFAASPAGVTAAFSAPAAAPAGATVVSAKSAPPPAAVVATAGSVAAQAVDVVVSAAAGAAASAAGAADAAGAAATGAAVSAGAFSRRRRMYSVCGSISSFDTGCRSAIDNSVDKNSQHVGGATGPKRKVTQ